MSSKASVNKQKQKQKQPQSARNNAALYKARDTRVTKLGVAQKKTRSAASKMHNNLAQMAMQLALPGKTTPLVLPNSTPSQVCARTYRKVVDVSQATSNNLKVIMLPDLFSPGFVTTNSTVIVPTGAPAELYIKGTCKATPASAAAAPNFPAAPFQVVSPSNSGVVICHDTDGASPFVGAGQYGRGLTGTFSAASIITVVLTNSGNTPVSPVVSFFSRAGAVNTLILSETLPQAKSVSFTHIVAAGGYSTLYWTIDSNSKDQTIDFAISATKAQLTSGATIGFAPAFDQQIIDNNISAGRVTAMSIFAQCTTAVQYNSGNINAGRVPYTFNPLSDISGQMASLPKNRVYQGKFQDGAYVTWLPSQLEECEINEIPTMAEIYSKSEFLVVEIPNWVAGATARLEFTWSVEFYTPNQNYEKILTPPRSPDWNAVYYALLCCDAAHCNPEHENYAVEFVSKVKKAVQTAAAWYDKHQDTLWNVAEAIATGAALLV